jgi:hypothetical protein
MAAVAGVWKKKRDDLKAKRNRLFEAYTKDSQNIQLAREIKAIDDEISEFSHHVDKERRAERAASPSDKLVTTPK